MYSTGKGWIEETLIHQHHQELLKEAEHYRLVQQALAARASETPGLPLRTRASAWLGNHFVDWGNALLASRPKEQVREQGC